MSHTAKADAVELGWLISCRQFLHRSPDLRQVIAKSLDQITFHANRIGGLIAISGPQLAIRIGQQRDRLAEQEHQRRYMLLSDPRGVSIAVGLALLRPMLRAFTRAAEPAIACQASRRCRLDDRALGHHNGHKGTGALLTITGITIAKRLMPWAARGIPITTGGSTPR
jgi:hypothetical protein